ncbi:MAG: hypothetical protein AAF196_03600 [Planctomycetota bacterium]
MSRNMFRLFDASTKSEASPRTRSSRLTFPQLSVSALMSGALALSALTLVGCSGGSSGSPENRGAFVIQSISTGQGQIWPYRVRAIDPITGMPGTEILNIESQADLATAVDGNDVLPVATFPVGTTLINGEQGNQFMLFRFSNALSPRTILSENISDQLANSGLTSALSIVAYDPTLETTVAVRGRGFVNGQTFIQQPNGSLELVQAVEVDTDGDVQVVNPIANGFPRGFFGDTDLVGSNVFVFIADTDGNLSTLESFDPDARNLLLQIRVDATIQNTDGSLIENDAAVATTVGRDPNPANVVGFSGNRLLQISPGNGQTDVPTTEPILIDFNKPVQPSDVGQLFSRTDLTPTPGGITLRVTIAQNDFTSLYYADPVSPGDLMSYMLRPASAFPGQELVNCSVTASQIRALKDLTPLGNDVETEYRTGDGVGLVNAPVAPGAIYIGLDGATPGIQVIDVNGFGQGTNGLDPDPITGEPTQSPLETFFAENNPNIGLPGITPNLFPGTSTVDAGSDGPFTLTENTDGGTILAGSPLLASVTDIQIGSPLDVLFNDADGNPNADGQNQVNVLTNLPQTGNSIVVEPHPNPPKLIFPPLSLDAQIFGEEPTAGGMNQLIPGATDDFRMRTVFGFFGPAAPPPSPPPPLQFMPFSSRQQVGHFLYVLDSDNNQIQVLNSNRMTLLATIPQSDPVNLAISPNLAILACANFASSTVSFVDIDPRSPTFHTVIAETSVAEGPIDVVFQPDGETCLALSSIENSLTVIGTADYVVDTQTTGAITDPIGVVCTPRYLNTGNTSNLYYAYILNGDGTVTVFESGPDGTNGIGFDDIIGTIQPQFPDPTDIVFDYASQLGGFWVTHRDEFGVAQISRVELTGSPQGPVPIQQNTGNFVLPPTFRQKEWTVTDTIGGIGNGQPTTLNLSGNSVTTIAFDDLLTGGANPNQLTNFNGDRGQSIWSHSAKGAILGGAPASTPNLMFVALSDVGLVDVVDLRARVVLATIDAPGVSVLSNYFRQ